MNRFRKILSIIMGSALLGGAANAKDMSSLPSGKMNHRIKAVREAIKRAKSEGVTNNELVSYLEKIIQHADKQRPLPAYTRVVGW